jgi:ketosteroid isomerase-like protein
VSVGLTLNLARADEYSEISQLAKAGKLAEAMTRVDQYLSTQPKDAQMRFIKGVIQKDAGKTSDAIATFTRLTEDYPELPEPYNNLAVLYAGQGQFDRARNALEMAIRTNPSYSTAHENLGDVYSKLASQAYNKALQLDNANTVVPPKLALIREIFNPTGGKGQRPIAPPSIATPPSTALATVTKLPPTLAPTPTIKPAAPSPLAASTTPPVSTATATSQTNSAPAKATAPAQIPPATAKPAAAPPAAAAAPVPAQAPAAPAAPAPTASVDKEIVSSLKAWAAAWASRDVKTYLSFYGKSFEPPGGLSRAAWEEERRQRISSKSTISVKLDNINVSVSGPKAIAKFRQDYKANGLAVSSRKTIELQKAGDKWLIVKESIGG